MRTFAPRPRQPQKSTLPPVVREVLGSHGRASDSAERLHAELLPGHDFSRIRIHADRSGAEDTGRDGFVPVRKFEVHAPSPPLQAPDSAQSQPKGDKARLKKLYAAAKATPLGEKFIGEAGGEPDIVWGTTDSNFHGQYDSDQTITLNEAEAGLLSDCQWQQVIVMELGNFANEAALFNPVYEEAEKGNLGKEDFVNAIEKIEYDTRAQVIEAYEGGQFGAPGPDCPSIFPSGKVSFETYLNSDDLAPHIAALEGRWEKYFRKAYQKKHRTN